MERAKCLGVRYLTILIVILPLKTIAGQGAQFGVPLRDAESRPESLEDHYKLVTGDFNQWLIDSLKGKTPKVARSQPSIPDPQQKLTKNQSVIKRVKRRWDSVRSWAESAWRGGDSDHADRSGSEFPKTSQELDAMLPKVNRPSGSTSEEVKREVEQFQKAPLFSSNKAEINIESLPVSKVGDGDRSGGSGVKVISRLAIEKEAKIKAEDLRVDIKVTQLPTTSSHQALPSPMARKVSVPMDLKGPRDLRRDEDGWKKEFAASLLKAEDLAKIQWPLSETVKDPEVFAYKPLSQSEREILEAAILSEKYKGCHVSVGLYLPAMEDKVTQRDALVEFGLCNFQLGLYTRAMDVLLPLISDSHPKPTERILGQILKDLPEEYEVDVFLRLRKLKNMSLIPKGLRDKAYYTMAKVAMLQGKPQLAKRYAGRVGGSVPLIDVKARLVLALAEASSKPKKALLELKNIEKLIRSKGIQDRDALSVMFINLARLHFKQDEFKQAFTYFQKVDKNHPLWIQAMTEMGWTQIALGDYPGAIGNMYSLHSPYFKTVFKPQTFAIRAVGYLGICQYGDAYRSITYLENTHRDWEKAIKAYQKNQTNPLSYYVTVLKYLKGKSDQSVDGLAPEVLREIGRQREFLNFQMAINRNVDEESAYEEVQAKIAKVISSLNWRIKKAEERLAVLQRNIEKAKDEKELQKSLNQWEAQSRAERKVVARNRLEKSLISKNAQAFAQEQKRSVARLEQETKKFKKLAGKALKGHLKKVEHEIQMVLENNEFLRYEIFAGAGENLRYQTAGGSAQNTKRIPSHIKPKNIVKWSFDGEYWEDEIGNYRSSLKSQCPQYNQAQLNGSARLAN